VDSAMFIMFIFN